MCELFAVTSSQPTTVSVSLEQFASHGNDDSKNKDGWGIVYYFERDIRRFRDTGTAADSAWVKFVEEQSLRSTQVLAHIRHANVGSVCLANTHPFSRELGGSMHTFAHNGYLKGITKQVPPKQHRFRPIGDTDSEYAFCLLLDRLCGLWMNEKAVPAVADRLKVITAFAREIRKLGQANFIYSDGDSIFVHADRFRQSDDGFRGPGLWFYEPPCPDRENTICGGGISIDAHRPAMALAMVASVPITPDAWEPMGAGIVLAMKNGKVVAKAQA